MKTTRTIGLLVVTGIGIGALVSYLLPGLNFGLGTGTAENGAKGTANPDAPPPGSNKPKQPAKSRTATGADESGVPAEVVFVLIEDREYLLRRGPEGQAVYESADVDMVVKAALAATGDSNGIKIRIAQKSSSRELAERQLKEKLEAAGIKKDAIRWKDEPVE